MTGRRIRQGGIDPTSAAATGDDDVTGQTVYSPSRLDPVVRAASTVVGGPAGRRLASRTGFWGAIPVLILLAAAMLSFGIVEKQHCRAQGWSSPDQFWHACYSDIPVLYGSAPLGGDSRSGLVDSLGQGGLGQPPLSGALMWITSSLVPNGPDAARNFFDLSAVLLLVVLVIGVAAVALTAGRRSWDAAHLAVSPVLITAGLISYQLLAVTLLAVTLLALARGRPIVAGLLLGLAVASAPQVAVVGLAVVVLAGRFPSARAGSVPGPAVTVGGSALACWLIVRVVLLPGLTGQLSSAWKGWVDAVPGYGSLWLTPQLFGASEPNPAESLGGRALQLLFGWVFRIGALGGTSAAVLSLLSLAALVVTILRFTLIADGPDSENPELTSAGEFIRTKVAPLSLALLAAVLFTAKSLPIQASLLLLPLIALSGLRWRDHLIWAGTEVAYFVAIWLYIAGETTPNRGLPALFYLILLAARLSGIAWIGVQGVLTYRSSVESVDFGPDEPMDEVHEDRVPADRFLPR